MSSIENLISAKMAQPPKPKKEKPKSREQRWNEAAQKAREGLEDLKSLQEEFEEWRDNMSENLQGSTTYELLDTICEIDIESAIECLNEVDEATIPKGFGRD